MSEKRIEMMFPVFADNAITFGRIADALLGRIGDPEGYEESIVRAEREDEAADDGSDRVEVLTDDILCELAVAGYSVSFDFDTRCWRVDRKEVPAKVWTLATVYVDRECYAEGPEVLVSAFRSRESAIEAAKVWWLAWTGDDEVDEELDGDLARDGYACVERGAFDVTISIEEKEIGA